MQRTITHGLIHTFTKSLDTNTHIDTLQRAVTSNGIYATAEHSALSATNTTVFSHEIATSSVSDQKTSGRCGLFATLNTLRCQIIKDFNMDDFELSQSYSYFWDKLEKSNSFYEQVIDSASLPLDDRKVSYLLTYPQGDGGWWEYSAALIMKYGIVPKSAMPESESTTDSRQLNTLLSRKLRKDALTLRSLVASGKTKQTVQQAKHTMLGEIYQFLTIAIGTPPTTFDFAYRDKDKKFHRENSITPTKFYEKYIHKDLSQYVSLMNDPSPDKRYNQPYAFEKFGNVVEGPKPLFINVDIETMLKLTKKQIIDGEPVWFAGDIHMDTNKSGFMSPDVHNFNDLFGIDFEMSKADQLATRDSGATHAMSITGVDIVNNKPVQWKLENSWGDEKGKKGYYTMSTDWFKKYGYVVVIRKDLLPAETLSALNKPPILLAPWNPLAGLGLEKV